jgi:hypothetical protein
MMRSAVLLLSGVLAISASGASAQTGAERVTFCAAVVQLVEAHCIGVPASSFGARAYDITGAKPSPAVGTLISGSGVPGGITMCSEGTHLTDVKWARVAACPLHR